MQGLKSRIKSIECRSLSFPAEALTPGFVRIVGHVERVHLQNRLKGELLTMWLKFGVAPSGFLTSIDEVVREKLKTPLERT